MAIPAPLPEALLQGGRFRRNPPLGTTEHDATHGTPEEAALRMDVHYPEFTGKPVPARKEVTLRW